MRTKRSGSSPASMLAMVCCLRCFAPWRGERDVVVLRFDVVELRGRDQRDARAVADDDALEDIAAADGRRLASSVACVCTAGFSVASAFGAPSAALRFSATRFLTRSERALEAFAANRLQQIIDGVDLEGFHRVLIVGRCENHGDVAFDQFEHVEAGQLRHLHIEKNQIGFVFGDGFHGLEAVGAFREHLNLRMRLKQFAQHLAGQLFVVDDQRADFVFWSRRSRHDLLRFRRKRQIHLKLIGSRIHAHARHFGITRVETLANVGEAHAVAMRRRGFGVERVLDHDRQAAVFALRPRGGSARLRASWRCHVSLRSPRAAATTAAESAKFLQSSVMFSVICRREPKRTFSIAKNRWKQRKLLGKRNRRFSRRDPRSSAKIPPAECTSPAPCAGSLLVSALIEFKLLKKKMRIDLRLQSFQFRIARKHGGFQHLCLRGARGFNRDQHVKKSDDDQIEQERR